MKPSPRLTCLAIVFALFGIVAVPARAEEPSVDTPRLEKLAQQLNLTEDQKAAITPILQKQAEELRAVKADTSVRKMQKLRRVRDINQRASEQIRPLLDPEQQKKYDEMRAAMKEEMKSRIKERKAQESGGA